MPTPAAGAPKAGSRAGPRAGSGLTPRLGGGSPVHAPDTLEPERLLLRQFLESDRDLYARICADPEVMRHIGDGRTLTREETCRTVATSLGY